ncbi:hypothetical protein EDC32_10518 [Laceyella sacchari]|jgi:hypothetical protein|nr:hypothetical protein EDC32_10518 [Laceyella sacchari]
MASKKELQIFLKRVVANAMDHDKMIARGCEHMIGT